MNILHLKYAVEVAKCGSINKAAEALLMNQPNLSRAIKELEASLGVSIFARSSKGMELTPEGEIFLRYANNILKQVDEVEGIFKKESFDKKVFSVSVPRASYISEAFSKFSMSLNDTDEAEIIYEETSSEKVIKNILESDFKLGIIRYEERFDKYYKEMLEEKGFNYEMVTEFCYNLLINKESKLASYEDVVFSDLKDYTEIVHADSNIPTLPFSKIKKDGMNESSKRRIVVFERASQFEILSQNPETFMWVSPVPRNLLDKYGLVQKNCSENKNVYKDVIIYKNDYRLSELDNIFISELCKSKRELF